MSNNPLGEVLTRLKQLTHSQSDAELSRALNISPQTLSSWKVRQSIPYALCVELARAHLCSLDWLLLGEGEQHRSSVALSEWEVGLLAQLRELAGSDRQAILIQVQDRQRLKALESQLQQLLDQMPAPHA
ncbi:helix-turn-helix domain-containing protein [Pseudomonas cremoricolorata]|uniref:helix-turn-helix domain-containing protein n=1 Tax=Pseudomonas cremoricolorata TaxID=157783 RepID=UPI00042701B9|nr:helix-turn-helix domain-containing protein [Pseudomonas cremoricolorata]